jgi:5-formyltetrahydrofolate cyclo-ligase
MLPTDKSELRAEGLRRRRAYAQSLDDSTRASLEAALARLVLPHLITARVIAAYHPLRDEISPAGIIAGLGPGQRYGLPWFEHRDALFLWREGPANEPSPWGVAQPSAEAEALAPDVVLVPIVLADRHGVRIGHGKGHYDRALAHLKASHSRPVITIGLCWPDQLVDGPLPADSWDMRLDAVATPGEWVTCA